MGKCDGRISAGGPFRRGRGRSGCASAGAAVIILSIILLAGPSAAQPRATIRPHPQTLPLNRHLRITLDLVWSGEADVYDVPLPDLSGLEEFEILEQSLSASRGGEENRLRYEFTMKPKKEGEYDFGKAIVKYYEKGVDVPTAIVLPRTIVKVAPRETIPLSAKIALGVSVVVGAGALAGFLALRAALRAGRDVRNKEIDASAAAGRRRESLLAELAGAAPLRIEGEMGAYLEKLCALAESHDLWPHAARIDDLRELAENVKFGGLTPSPDQLSWAEKLVRKAVDKAFPEKQDSEED